MISHQKLDLWTKTNSFTVSDNHGKQKALYIARLPVWYSIVSSPSNMIDLQNKINILSGVIDIAGP